MTYSLILQSPVLLASGEPNFVMDLTPDHRVPGLPMRAQGWRRTIRGIGGYWDGEFTLYGRLDDLSRFFYEFLGYHIVERSGGYQTWEGMVYQMDLTSDGTTMQRTFDNFYPHVRTRYQDTDNNIQITTAATDDESIRVFGRREIIWPLTGQDLAAAESDRDKILTEYSRPRARPFGMTLGTVGEASLFVRVCGYVFTANWRYESAGDDTDDSLSTWVSEIVAADCPFLQVANIVANATVVRKSNKREMRAWDVITKMLELGSANQKPARAYVDNGRRFYYEEIATSAVYFKRGGGFFNSPGANLEVNPWKVRPAVVRNLTYPVRNSEIGAWLSDARDAYMNEVEVWDTGEGKPRLVPKTEEYGEAEILTAMRAYEEQLMRLREQEELEANRA